MCLRVTQKMLPMEVMQKQGTVEADAEERIEFRDPPQQYDSEEHEGPVARNPVGQPQEVEGYLNHLTDTNRHYSDRGDVVVAEVLLGCACA